MIWGSKYAISCLEQRLVVGWIKKIPHTSPTKHFREIITAAHSNFFNLHFKLLVQRVCQQIHYPSSTLKFQWLTKMYFLFSLLYWIVLQTWEMCTTMNKFLHLKLWETPCRDTNSCDVNVTGRGMLTHFKICPKILFLTVRCLERNPLMKLLRYNVITIWSYLSFISKNFSKQRPRTQKFCKMIHQLLCFNCPGPRRVNTFQLVTQVNYFRSHIINSLI